MSKQPADKPDTVALVQVVWLDACHSRDPKGAKPLKVMSFGLLLKESPEGVVLAQNQSEVGEFFDCIYIPGGAVVETTRIPLPEGKGVFPA